MELGAGKTVSLDRVTLPSRRLGLTGRPDRLVKSGGVVISEEWKSSRRLRDSHRAQLGIYFLLIEDQMERGRRTVLSFAVTAHVTGSTTTPNCGPGCSAWSNASARLGRRSTTRLRSIRCRLSAGAAGNARNAGRQTLKLGAILLQAGDQLWAVR